MKVLRRCADVGALLGFVVDRADGERREAAALHARFPGVGHDRLLGARPGFTDVFHRDGTAFSDAIRTRFGP